MAQSISDSSTGKRSEEDTVEIPYIPSSEYECQNNVSVWWFERNFCQTWFGDASRESNACTLIALLMAAKVAKRNLQMSAEDDHLPHLVVRTFAEAIIQGNSIYSKMCENNQLPNPILNIPEAMEAGAEYLSNIQEWKAFVYVSDMTKNIYDSMKQHLSEWNTKRKDPNFGYLFVLSIAATRSILLVFHDHPGTITLFDSHQHSIRHGSVVAQVSVDHLKELCEWIVGLFTEVYRSFPNCYELSFIEIKK